MGTIPQEGDSCRSDGTLFTVRKVVDRRIEEIEMSLSAADPSGPQTAGQG